MPAKNHGCLLVSRPKNRHLKTSRILTTVLSFTSFLLSSGSVRQNILFGQPFVKSRYMEVCRVCALERDISLFPHGDKTVVGERGVSLSGGQRARINLARAVYKDVSFHNRPRKQNEKIL